ncbi:hypothetical protein PROFUN_01905 [Planoprotostelium fungivorum]|uniref:Uncharacterized protein n=1 Tax=Planoprotostelium fungivorum TaxID=1890364 RepID=A0A2P6NZ03_9EUKA|nr:hypothetical protein PROFUN_01905 [Planoprotostelium fungivorum]
MCSECDVKLLNIWTLRNACVSFNLHNLLDPVAPLLRPSFQQDHHELPSLNKNRSPTCLVRKVDPSRRLQNAHAKKEMVEKMEEDRGGGGAAESIEATRSVASRIKGLQMRQHHITAADACKSTWNISATQAVIYSGSELLASILEFAGHSWPSRDDKNTL